MIDTRCSSGPRLLPASESRFDYPRGISISEFLDIENQEKEKRQEFDRLASSQRRKLEQLIVKRERLLQQLQLDLKDHGDADRWKRYGDLLLANSSSAVVKGNKVLLKDFFQDQAPDIEIEIDENETITRAAEKFYKRYTKARNASAEISKREKAIEAELTELRSRERAP